MLLCCTFVGFAYLLLSEEVKFKLAISLLHKVSWIWNWVLLVVSFNVPYIKYTNSELMTPYLIHLIFSFPLLLTQTLQWLKQKVHTPYLPTLFRGRFKSCLFIKKVFVSASTRPAGGAARSCYFEPKIELPSACIRYIRWPSGANLTIYWFAWCVSHYFHKKAMAIKLVFMTRFVMGFLRASTSTPKKMSVFWVF